MVADGPQRLCRASEVHVPLGAVHGKKAGQYALKVRILAPPRALLRDLLNVLLGAAHDERRHERRDDRRVHGGEVLAGHARRAARGHARGGARFAARLTAAPGDPEQRCGIVDTGRRYQSRAATAGASDGRASGAGSAELESESERAPASAASAAATASASASARRGGTRRGPRSEAPPARSRDAARRGRRRRRPRRARGRTARVPCRGAARCGDHSSSVALRWSPPARAWGAADEPQSPWRPRNGASTACRARRSARRGGPGRCPARSLVAAVERRRRRKSRVDRAAPPRAPLRPRARAQRRGVASASTAALVHRERPRRCCAWRRRARGSCSAVLAELPRAARRRTRARAASVGDSSLAPARRATTVRRRERHGHHEDGDHEIGLERRRRGSPRRRSASAPCILGAVSFTNAVFPAYVVPPEPSADGTRVLSAFLTPRGAVS